MFASLLATALIVLDTRNVAVRHLTAAELQSPCERALIHAVRAASPPSVRGDLIVTRIRGVLYLWYGDPDYPSGILPFGVDDDRNYQDGYPTETRANYRVIGPSCNFEMAAADRHPFAATGAGCDSWRPSKADLAVARFAACNFAGSD